MRPARPARGCTCWTRRTPRGSARSRARSTSERTLFVVSSKSGGTIEPLSLFAHFFSLVQEEGNRFVAITDPGSGLEALAAKHAFLRTFAGDPNIGGRYSALSAFGVVPGALMGIPVLSLLEGAPSAWETGLKRDRRGRGRFGRRRGARMAATTGSDGLPAAVWLGAALSGLARAGRDKLTFVISETLPGLGLWLEQLVAESTGKHGTGILPVADEPLGEPAVYGDDRVFAYLPDVHAPDPELERRVQALADAGHPVFTIPTAGPRTSGACSCSPSSPSRSSAGVFRSTPSTSPTCSRRRTPPTACSPATRPATSCPPSPTPTTRRCARCSGTPPRPATSRSWLI